MRPETESLEGLGDSLAKAMRCNARVAFCLLLSDRKNRDSGERPLMAASSTDRCSTFCELLGRRLHGGRDIRAMPPRSNRQISSCAIICRTAHALHHRRTAPVLQVLRLRYNVLRHSSFRQTWKHWRWNSTPRRRLIGRCDLEQNVFFTELGAEHQRVW
jgi:hypothetical protein